MYKQNSIFVVDIELNFRFLINPIRVERSGVFDSPASRAPAALLLTPAGTGCPARGRVERAIQRGRDLLACATFGEVSWTPDPLSGPVRFWRFSAWGS